MDRVYLCLVIMNQTQISMEKNNRHQLAQWLPFMLAVLLVGVMAGMVSCGNDEPELKVGYYMSISSSESFMASEDDESQGTMSETPNGNVLYTTISRMKRAMVDAYPTPDTNGADAAVLMACDRIYRNYKTMYGPYERNTVCVVKIMRVGLDEGKVVTSRTLTTYSFGALPPDKDHSEI